MYGICSDKFRETFLLLKKDLRQGQVLSNIFIICRSVFVQNIYHKLQYMLSVWKDFTVMGSAC